MYSKKEYLKHGILFLLTLITSTLAGGEWLYGKSVLSKENPLTWEYFWLSMQFSIPFIGILLVHELGHLFTSIYHKVKSSLPFFMPGWLGFIGMPSIGTFGAVIQMRSMVSSRKKFFDIGIAGPLAGFVLAFFVLWYGFTHLPDASYIYEIHPEYADPDYQKEDNGGENDIVLGYNLLFWLMENTLAEKANMPDMSELYHYPFLFAGYLALFFTALNLLPMGQLDGGHIVFGLFKNKHKQISFFTFTAFLFFAGLGIVSPFEPLDYLVFAIPLYIGFVYICYRKTSLSNQTKWMITLTLVAVQYAVVSVFPHWEGYNVWLLFVFLIGRVLGIEHPEVMDGRPISRNRKILGWLAIVIFILCFTPRPFIFE